MAVTFVTCFLATAYGPIFRKQIKNVSETKMGLTMGYLLEYLLKLYVMLLMMSMNAYVCLAIAVGTALGYSFFGVYGERIRKRIFQRE